MLVAVERGVIRTMSGQNPSRRTIAEPRLGLLALVAALVVVLCVVALAHTDDIWIIAVTIAAIALIAVVITVDLFRVMGDGDGDSDGG
jgi:hypothetical protein